MPRGPDTEPRSAGENAVDARREATPPAGATDAHVGGGMVPIPRAECVRLLAATSVGRLAVNAEGGPPIIRPVNYLFDHRLQSVVFRTAPGSKLHALTRSADAAFEIDGVDHATRSGWSVIIRGRTEEVDTPAEVRRLTRLGLRAWAPGEKPHWMRIRAWTVSGARTPSDTDAPEHYLG